MAQPSRLLRVRVDLSDIDRGVYDALDLRVAQHPSENDDRVVCRVLAFCLLHQDGLAFGRGLSTVEDAALQVTDPGGAVSLWVDVGAPSADRLHKASKGAGKVVVVTHKDEATLHKEWKNKKVHQAQDVEVIRLGERLVNRLAEDVAAKWTWAVIIQDGALMVTSGEDTLQGPIDRTTVDAIQRS